MCVRKSVHVRVCKCVRVSMHVCVCVCACVRACVRACARAHVHESVSYFVVEDVELLVIFCEQHSHLCLNVLLAEEVSKAYVVM